MPANIFGRLAALNQVQGDRRTRASIDQALQGEQSQAQTKPVRSTAGVSTFNNPFGDLGNVESVRQPLEQMEAINNYQPTRTNIEPLPSNNAIVQGQATDNSLTSYLQNQAIGNAVSETTGTYSESMSNSIGQALDTSARVGSQLQGLGQASPEVRAQLGGQFGAGVGAAIGGGAVGALIGSGVGAIAGRSIGMVQSGEMDSMRRRQGVLDTLSTMGAMGEGYRTPFEGGTLQIGDDTRLPNISGSGDRSVWEIDMSNPLSRRSTTVARPLARYVAQGLMNQLDDDGGPITRSVDQTTGMLVNMFTDNVNSIDQVYGRARQFAEKLGVTQDGIRTFFNANKHRFNAQEANEIRKGLDTIYGS